MKKAKDTLFNLESEAETKTGECVFHLPEELKSNIEMVEFKLNENNSFTVLPKTDYLSEEWHKTRSKGIGGSDVAGICGISKYSSPLSIWLKKTGRDQSNISNNFTEWGHILEDVVADYFSKKNNVKLESVSDMLQSKEFPFMLGSVDRVILNEKGEFETFLECKTASEYLLEDWGNLNDENDNIIPDAYLLQIQHYMAVLGVDYCYIACLVGGNKYTQKRIQRDNELISNIIGIEKGFWDFVLTDKMPEPTWTDTDVVKKLFEMNYSEENDQPVDLFCENLIEEYNQISSKIDELEKEALERKNKIVAYLNGHTEGYTEKYRISFRYSNCFSEDIVKEKYPDMYSKYQIKAFDKDMFKKENKDIYAECTEKKSPKFLISENKKSIRKGA